MITSSAGKTLIETFESLRLTAYIDAVGIPTIGYGTTIYPNGIGVKEGDVCTQEQADTYFSHDLEKTESYVDNLVNVVITQNQFDALVSFTYNVGPGNFQKSSVLKFLNKEDYNGAQPMFLLWNKGKNRDTGMYEVLLGLSRRRVAEAALFGPLSAVDLISRYKITI